MLDSSSRPLLSFSGPGLVVQASAQAQMNLLGPKIPTPDWIDVARRYYSEIEPDGRGSVRIMRCLDDGDASDENPGTLYMHLVPDLATMRVLDSAGNEQGVIAGTGFRHSMRRAGSLVWTVSTRSLVMRRHLLKFSGRHTWTVRTPFFWWTNILCTVSGSTVAIGEVGPRKWLWFLWIHPGDDNHDFLSALGFLHRRWWCM